MANQSPSWRSTLALNFWAWNLRSRLSLLAWLAPVYIVRKVESFILYSHPGAAQAALEALLNHPSQRLRDEIAAVFRRPLPIAASNLLWEFWYYTRSPILEEVALSASRAATRPAEIRLASLLKLDKTDSLKNATRADMPHLISFLDDHDPALKENAHRVLQQLQRQESIDALVYTWAEYHSVTLMQIIKDKGYLALSPPREKVLSALLNNRAGLLLQGEPDLIPPLVNLLSDPDEHFSRQAGYVLRNLSKTEMIDEFCRLEQSLRQPALRVILLECGYIASAPLPVKLYCLLVHQNPHLCQSISSDAVSLLLDYCDDEDEQVADYALQVALHLENMEPREEVCRLFLHADRQRAGRIALQANYRPSQSDQRAAFLLLAEQWDEYDRFDSDQRLMQAFYSNANAQTRQRIAGLIQKAGRADLIHIMTSARIPSRTPSLTMDEIPAVASLLIGQKDWLRLWTMLEQFPVTWVSKFMLVFQEAQWRPSSDADCILFDQMAHLQPAPLPDSPELSFLLQPPAILKIEARVHGRVNDIAFSPSKPWLALAGGNRCTALWDYSKAAMVQRLREFDHAIGCVEFTPSGQLLCAEKSLKRVPCALKLWSEDGLQTLGHHGAAISGVSVSSENRVVSIGRDGYALFWNAASHSQEGSLALPFQPRALSLVNGKIGLLARDIHLLDPLTRTLDGRLPVSIRHLPNSPSGVPVRAAYLPAAHKLLVGFSNGEIAAYDPAHPKRRQRPSPIVRFTNAVRDIQAVPNRSLAVAASSASEIVLIDESSLTVVHRLPWEGKKITSLQVSPRGDFFACGTDDARLHFWDLRANDLPGLLPLPIASMTLQHLSLIESFAGEPALPQPVRNALQILRLLLQRRFQYDILISEPGSIRAGEYDIYLDE